MILTLIYNLAWSVRKKEWVIHICNFTTTERRDCLSRTISEKSHTEPVHHGRIELDSHAETVVFGRNSEAIHFTERECYVSPYTDAYEPIKSVKIACAGMAWTSPASGETYILVFKEGLWMEEKMDHTLVNPNQMRHLLSSGIGVRHRMGCLGPYFQSGASGWG